MKNVKEVYFPQSFKEFFKVFKKNSYLFAGSVYSFKSVQNNNDLKRIIFIDKMPLKYVKKYSDYLAVGSLSTFDDLEHNSLTKTLFGGFISYASSKCSSQLIRNMATVGGNIYHPSAFNIMPVVLMTAGGGIVVDNGKSEKTYSVSDFYRYRPSGLIKEIRFPLKHKNDIFYFEKISKSKSSWESYMTVSFRVKLSGPYISDGAFVIGGINAVPYTNNEIFEKHLRKRKINQIDIESFINEYSSAVFKFGSVKFAYFRKQVLSNMIKDFFKKIMEGK